MQRENVAAGSVGAKIPAISKAITKENGVNIDTVAAKMIEDYKDQLDRKEYIIQMKESKWNDIERIMANYAKTDYVLKDQLVQLKYLCVPLFTNGLLEH